MCMKASKQPNIRDPCNIAWNSLDAVVEAYDSRSYLGQWMGVQSIDAPHLDKAAKLIRARLKLQTHGA